MNRHKSYKKYDLGTRIRVKKTGDEGEAFESALGYISVFFDDENGDAFLFKLEEVEFLNEPEEA